MTVRVFWPFVAIVALAGCATPARDVALAGANLADPAVLARLGEGLSEKERGALATYALLHWPGSKSYCGRPVFRDGRQPATVGEAVAKTLEFEQALADKRATEDSPTSQFEARAERDKQLADEMDWLTQERDMLATAQMPAAQLARETKAIEAKLDRVRLERRKLAAEQLAAAEALNR